MLLADKNPAYQGDMGVRNSESNDFPIMNESSGWTDDDGDNPWHGNSLNHETEMQNVLFADTHVKKFDAPLVGIEQDNIYTYWSGGVDSTADQKRIGRWDQNHSVALEDSYLGN
jgi:hypothetical protein